ncbi:hypothetical protein C7447_101955 [Tenacibaculum adriaticum]|uniref:Uncharacterized protein n=1 Tax=Tenacibaculum adriaticum TaxID=413713 RepID=A0A5S5E018_9FLAO|nr:hypothetical protein [Tenacibaculum adriaticum]TYQ00343.1 hypothetical protein C7447_101955 [Tenacibaculum adriaticum]
MKKQILNLGKALNKAEQKKINGGRPIKCYSNPNCPPYGCCIVRGNICEVIDENDDYCF